MEHNIVTLAVQHVQSIITYFGNRADVLRDAIPNVKKELPQKHVKGMEEKMLKLADEFDRAKENLIANKTFYLDQISYTGFMGADAKDYARQLTHEFESSASKSYKELTKKYIKLQDEYGKLKESKTLKGYKVSPKKNSIRCLENSVRKMF